MSVHVATISLGRTGTAGGDLKVAEVIGHLYVGGSGMWRFQRLTDDTGRGAPSSDDPGEDGRVMLPSSGFDRLWPEAAACFAVLMQDESGMEQVPALLTELGISSTTDRLVPEHVTALAALVAEVNVAAALTVFGGQVPPEVEDLSAVPGWSVQVAAPVFERLRSRWGVTDTRTGAHS